MRTALDLSSIARARRSPASFAQLVDPSWQYFRWIQLLNRYLIEVASGRLRRLAVYVPPQHGKSTFLSRYFPAWYVGTFPTRRVILASYAFSLARSHGLAARRAIEGYGRTVFGVTIDRSSSAGGEWQLARRVNAGGMLSVGIGGGTTGRPANLFVIDDPHAGPWDASAPNEQEKVWDWYQAVATTRLHEQAGAVVLMLTRWHDGDLGGKIERHAAETGEEWVVLRLPALAEEDEALGEDVGYRWRRAKGEALEQARFSRTYLEERRKVVEPRWWLALYQQRPRKETGDVFSREHFRYYTSIETDRGLVYVVERLDADGRPTSTKRVVWVALDRFCTVDLALSKKEENDWTVISTWGLVRSTRDLLLLDVVRARMEAPEIQPALLAARIKHQVGAVHVEATAYQASVVQYAKRAGLPALPYQPKGDKRTRAIFAASRIEGGGVWFPAPPPAWLADWEAELVEFDTGEHDDQVDTISMATALTEGEPDRTLRRQ